MQSKDIFCSCLLWWKDWEREALYSSTYLHKSATVDNDNSGILRRSILVMFHMRKILAESSDYFNITLLINWILTEIQKSQFLHQSSHRVPLSLQKEADYRWWKGRPSSDTHLQTCLVLNGCFSILYPSSFSYSPLSVWIRRVGYNKD